MNVKPEIKDKILAAVQALVAEGVDSPTNDQVRERMGGGSLSHISPVMRHWRESRKAEVVAALEMPADLKKVVESSLGQVWTAASKLASAEIDAVQQEAGATVEVVSSERDEALTEISRLEAQLAELKKALEAKDKTLSQTQKTVDEERQKNAQLNSDNAALTARVNDREGQIHELKAELKESRADNKKLQGELVEIARGANNKDPG